LATGQMAKFMIFAHSLCTKNYEIELVFD